MLARVFVVLAVATALRSPTLVAPSRTVAKMASDPYTSIATTLTLVEEKQLLSKLAKLGLLTKLEKAGLGLRDVEPLLVWGKSGCSASGANDARSRRERRRWCPGRAQRRSSTALARPRQPRTARFAAPRRRRLRACSCLFWAFPRLLRRRCAAGVGRELTVSAPRSLRRYFDPRRLRHQRRAPDLPRHSLGDGFPRPLRRPRARLHQAQLLGAAGPHSWTSSPVAAAAAGH